MTEFRPVLGVSCLVLHEDHVLLAKRGREPAKGLWSLPGGKVEHAERLHDAAFREVLEETGIRVCGQRFMEFVEIIHPDYHFVIAVFATRMMDRAPPSAGDDAEEAGWFALDALEALDQTKAITPGTYARVLRLAQTL